MAQQTALQKAIEEIKTMAGEFENQRIPAVYLLSKIIPLLEYEKEQLENARPQIISSCIIKEISDEEIEKAWSIVETTHVDKWVSFKSMFMEGAKWYREQLKNK